ncbi:TlpA family protein disulfide reductase [Ancylomarina longa]|uniref:Redoxin domain-containing protein n=1 Tax=Ancylomarina longa TaxID=2487017 RepID=A0A434AW81_9BACT|nr:redoxin family protein [Ancylomarina longa]RUT78771.1 hypothetical protein DLK05_06440 [Ancylomarina longa]
MIKNIALVVLLLFVISCASSMDDQRLMDTAKLNHFISQKDKTLVYVWTTWCSSCRATLAETLPKIKAEMDTSHYQLLLIAASKDRKEVDSLVTKQGLLENSYYLDFVGPDKGIFQNIGIQLLLERTFPNDKIFTRAIPVFFLVDRNKNILQKKIPHSYYEAIRVVN